jgi:uncharacterized protein (DUF58 family)
MTMLPSKRFYFFLFLGIIPALFLLQILDQATAIYGILAYDLLLIIVAFIDTTKSKQHRVKITRYPLHQLSIGRDNPILFSIIAPDRNVQIIIKDDYPLEFPVSNNTITANLEAQETKELGYTIHPDRRGEYKWGDLRVRQLSSWGLAWDDYTIDAAQKVSVRPDLVGLRSLSLRLTLENTGTLRQKRSMGIGTEFAELREYGIGDDTRSIDWKATARRGVPLVRVLEPEKEQTLIILLDRGRLMTAQVKGLKRFDWGLNATLSLALAGLNRGDRVGVGVFDKEVISWIPPERGKSQLSKLIDRLTPIQPTLLEPDYMGAVTRLVDHQTRRALVVIITDIVDEISSAELLTATMRLTPRYLPFCVTLRDPQVDNLAHNFNTSNLTSTNAKIEATYQRAVALDLLSQRQIAFAKLKQKGVLVLDAPADCISEQLVDRYLQLKSKNRL